MYITVISLISPPPPALFCPITFRGGGGVGVNREGSYLKFGCNLRYMKVVNILLFHTLLLLKI